ncbi:MAG: hypothetical protein H6837_15260 [Planctomycetes bacterium]|nr:hypothetical protein [Planctomycetota bacterium]
MAQNQSSCHGPPSGSGQDFQRPSWTQNCYRSPTCLQTVGLDGLPVLIAATGERAARRFLEFFTATIRNPNTRAAYARAAAAFLAWCEERGIRDLRQV